MGGASRAVRARVDQFAASRPGDAARLRLFGLLILLAALFAGLQFLVREAVPRVEVQFVPQDVPVLVPVERIVERVIERTVVVPVPVTGTPEPAALTPVPTPQSNGATPGTALVDSSGRAVTAGSGPGTGEVRPAGVGPIPGAPVANGQPGPSGLPPGRPRTPTPGGIVVATEDRLGTPSAASTPVAGSSQQTVSGTEGASEAQHQPDESDAEHEDGEQDARPASDPPARVIGEPRPLLVPAPIGVKPPPDERE